MDFKHTIKLLIVEDQELFRTSMAHMLNGQSVRNYRIDVVGTAASGESAIYQIKCLNPDVILMDYMLPDINGTDVAIGIQNKQPKSKIILLTSSDNDSTRLAAVAAKVDAFLLKTVSIDILLSTIVEVYSQASSTILLKQLEPEDSVINKLTRREKQILKLIAEGYKNAQMAEKLNLSIRTVENHRASLIKKMGTSHVSDLIRQALQHGLIE